MGTIRRCHAVLAMVLACGCGSSPSLSSLPDETERIPGANSDGGLGDVATDSAVASDEPAPSTEGGTARTDGGRSDAGLADVHADAGHPDSGADVATDVDAGSSDAHDDAGRPTAMRRIPLPCTAPLPTGFCLQSDPGDYIGGGKSYSAGSTTSVTLSPGGSNEIGLELQDVTTTSNWHVDFAAKAGARLIPELFDPAQRYPFQAGDVAGLSVYGNGRGCNTLTGKFSIEEIARDPLKGIARFSATFEQHCEGGAAALRGVVNFQASGAPDPTPGPDKVINLSGKIFRVAYDPTTNVAYGFDATNRRLAKIDLANGSATYSDIVQVPNDGCVDAKRGRVFVVNKGSTLITEYGTADLKAVRDIAWAGMDWGPMDTHFKIYCAPDKLYVVDGAWAPGLFTVDGLDGANPVATDHTSQVAGVGGLALTSTATELYYWYQYGWSAGSLSTSVRRLVTSDLSKIDETSASVPTFNRDPLDAPVLLDEMRGLVFVKNKIFDATNLTKVIYSLPSTYDTFDGAAENAYALDSKAALLATKNFVYDLSRYDIVAATITPSADQMFFDVNGVLWFLSISEGALKAQIIRR